MITSVSVGDRLEVRNAYGDWIPAVATSGIEGVYGMQDGRYRKIHDFPVVWVDVAGPDVPVPWPLTDIRAAGLGEDTE